MKRLKMEGESVRKWEAFLFHEFYFEAISQLKTNKSKVALLESMVKYALYGEEPERIPADAMACFILIKNYMGGSSGDYHDEE